MKNVILGLFILINSIASAQEWSQIQSISQSRTLLSSSNHEVGIYFNDGKDLVYQKFDGSKEIVAPGKNASSMGSTFFNNKQLLVFVDDATNKPAVALKENGVWKVVQENISSSFVYNLFVAAHGNVSYLAYTDTKLGYKQLLVFKTTDGKSFSKVAELPLEKGSISTTSMQFSKDGKLTIAYQISGKKSSTIKVYQLDNKTWYSIGKPIKCIGNRPKSLMLNVMSDRYFLSYADDGIDFQFAFKELKKGKWNDASDLNLSAKQVRFSCAEVSNGSLHLAYERYWNYRGTNSDALFFGTFDGTKWVNEELKLNIPTENRYVIKVVSDENFLYLAVDAAGDSYFFKRKK